MSCTGQKTISRKCVTRGACVDPGVSVDTSGSGCVREELIAYTRRHEMRGQGDLGSSCPDTLRADHLPWFSRQSMDFATAGHEVLVGTAAGSAHTTGISEQGARFVRYCRRNDDDFPSRTILESQCQCDGIRTRYGYAYWLVVVCQGDFDGLQSDRISRKDDLG